MSKSNSSKRFQFDVHSDEHITQAKFFNLIDEAQKGNKQAIQILEKKNEDWLRAVNASNQVINAYIAEVNKAMSVSFETFAKSIAVITQRINVFMRAVGPFLDNPDFANARISYDQENNCYIMARDDNTIIKLYIHEAAVYRIGFEFDLTAMKAPLNPTAKRLEVILKMVKRCHPSRR